MRILVADDDPTNLEILNVILTGAGHRVVLVSDAPTALATARTFQPDFVMMDAVMPGEFGGIEGIRRLRADPAFRGLIICQSAKASQVDQAEALSAGAMAYLTKPYRRRDVLGMIERLSMLTVKTDR